MKDKSDSLHHLCAESSAARDTFYYRNMSPRLEFGEGGTLAHQRLVSHDTPEIYWPYAGPEDGRHNAWLILESSAHLPPGEPRTSLLAKSIGRFARIADQVDSPLVSSRIAGYKSKIGLAAIYAFQAGTTTALEDNPGYYAEILGEVISDPLLSKSGWAQRRGLVSELTVATLASHLNYFTLPASSRHERPLSIETPVSAHDYQVWFKPPRTLPARPDRKVQVKTSSKNENMEYASNITVVTVNDHFEQSFSEQLARALVRMYNGSSINSQNKRCISQNGERLEAILEAEVTNDDVFAPRDGTMWTDRHRKVGPVGFKSRNA